MRNSIDHGLDMRRLPLMASAKADKAGYAAHGRL
jgi:hypothetical protein